MEALVVDLKATVIKTDLPTQQVQKCQSPLNKSPDCSGADDFSSSSVVAASLYTSFSTDLEALSEYNSKIIKFTNVDPLIMTSQINLEENIYYL